MVIKTRYFNLMKVYDATGKYLGSVQDIAIDFIMEWLLDLL